MLDDTAEAFGRRSRGRKAEGSRVALDIMGGAKKFIARRLVEAPLEDGR
jgi:hypothetical protein